MIWFDLILIWLLLKQEQKNEKNYFALKEEKILIFSLLKIHFKETDSGDKVFKKFSEISLK